jgi:hypothetical protein
MAYSISGDASLGALAFTLAFGVACSTSPSYDDDDGSSGVAARAGHSNGGGSAGRSNSAGSLNSAGNGGTTSAAGTAGSGGQGGVSGQGGLAAGGGQPENGGSNATAGSNAMAGSGATAGSGGTPSLCQAMCASNTDCASTLYSCQDGICAYRGCASDAECADFGSGTVCRPDPMYGVGDCVSACSTADDCGFADSPTFESTNYSCTDDGCIYKGCNSDAECDLYHRGDVCVQTPGSNPSCTPSCATPNDCPQVTSPPAYASPDHYACTQGHCVFLGCQSDDECTIPDAFYVCRPYTIAEGSP